MMTNLTSIEGVQLNHFIVIATDIDFVLKEESPETNQLSAL